MTERFDPRQHQFPERRYFEHQAVGERSAGISGVR
jgi:hypothetical protein